MSEEILKALMELFAMIVKQDYGTLSDEREYVYNFLSKRLTSESVEKFMALFDTFAGPVGKMTPEQYSTPTVYDSIKILRICKKINKSLKQQQKVVVVVWLYELLNTSGQFTPQRMNIIITVTEVFKISRDEVIAIEQFVRNNSPEGLVNPKILFIKPGEGQNKFFKRPLPSYGDTLLIFLRVPSVNLYFFKYFSTGQLYLNGLPALSGRIYTFANGSSIKSHQSQPIFYSDINYIFLSEEIKYKINIKVDNLTYKFSDGVTAVNNVSFSLQGGNLVGILGASGTGKTTLINLMSGILKPTSGSIKINGFDINKKRHEIEGVIGFVPQYDLLIDDLTVFENLFFAARQCFGSKSSEEIKKITEQTLSTLGLWEKRNLKVGSPLKNVISGGERKRLNIALELIREPSVLFLDEP
ncbi:MAG: ABC transporter ATP-binding protein, partial [Bacteroidales bacterium]|nr:ABC transporter ATP-binding protein [Bacteroidales bacterium]